ncbi:MAG: M56 family metallopeptidase [Bacteroidota bacterium]
MTPLIDVTTSIEALRTLGTASLSAFWVPVLLWTAVAGGLLLLGRRRRAHPQTHYELRLALLAALPVAFVLALGFGAWQPGWIPAPVQVLLPPPMVATPTVASVDVVFTIEAARPTALTLFDGWAWLGLLTVLASVASLVGLARLALHGRALARLRRTLSAPPEALAEEAEMLAAQIGVNRPVRFAVGPATSGPATFGWTRPVVVLSEALWSEPESRALTLRHELLHVRRGDYAVHLGVALLQAVFAAHPLVHVLARQIATYREAACDAALVASVPAERSAYARLLVRLHDAIEPRQRTLPALATGIRVRRTALQSRLEQLTQPSTTRTRRQQRRTRSIALVVVLAVSSVAACDSALQTTSVASSASEVDRFQMSNATLTYDSETLFSGFGLSVDNFADHYVHLHLPGVGVVTIATKPFPDAEEAGWYDDTQLLVEVAGKPLRLTYYNDGARTGTERYAAWVRVRPDAAPADMGIALSIGEDADFTFEPLAGIAYAPNVEAGDPTGRFTDRNGFATREEALAHYGLEQFDRPGLAIGPPRSVTFRYEPPENRRQVERVWLVGSFDGTATFWMPHPMERAGDAWTVTLTLAPGVYAYKFLLDGAWYPSNPRAMSREEQERTAQAAPDPEHTWFDGFWIIDPANDAQAQDIHGFLNSVRVVE